MLNGQLFLTLTFYLVPKLTDPWLFGRGQVWGNGASVKAGGSKAYYPPPELPGEKKPE